MSAHYETPAEAPAPCVTAAAKHIFVPGTRYRGTCQGKCPATGRRLIRIDMPDEIRADHAGQSPYITAEHHECRVTDGLERQYWDGKYDDVYAAPDQKVKFYINEPVEAPPKGLPINIPDSTRAIMVRASTNEPILILLKGRLDCWVVPKKCGFIRAASRDGGELDVYVPAGSLMGEGGIPCAPDAVPVVGEPVQFTARASDRKGRRRPVAQRVWALGGGPVLLRPKPAHSADDDLLADIEDEEALVGAGAA